MSNINDYQEPLLELIKHQETVYLSTIDADGYPSTRAMLNLKNPELYPHLVELYEKEENPFVIYLSTNTSSIKMREIIENNKVCLYYCKNSEYLGITLRGRIEIVTDKKFKRKAWAEGWEIYYPGGISSEDFTMLRFTPDKLKSYGDLNLITKELNI